MTSNPTALPRIAVVVGTRPEAIKMAPVIHAFSNCSEVVVSAVNTAQHSEMAAAVLSDFRIERSVDLAIGRAGQTPTEVLSRVITAVGAYVADTAPDWVLVHGDTTSALGAALAASYAGIKVGHVEAGLRSFDRSQPFPEELNRIAISSIADRHFAPTPRAASHLLAEGKDPAAVLVTGNTVIDALDWMVHNGPKPGEGSPATPQVLVTIHRRENHGAPLARIAGAIAELAVRNPDHTFVWPVHPNPMVKEVVEREVAGLSNIRLTAPMDYPGLVGVLSSARLVITDSGGLQEEAPSLGVPVLVAREVTERPEAVEAGTVRLVGSDPDLLVTLAHELLNDPLAHDAMARAVNPYGDGAAAQRIVRSLLGRPVDAWVPAPVGSA